MNIQWMCRSFSWKCDQCTPKFRCSDWNACLKLRQTECYCFYRFFSSVSAKRESVRETGWECERERKQSLCVCTQRWDVLVHKFSWLYTMPRSTTCSWNIENSIKLPVSSGCAVTMLHASTPFWINPSILLWQTLEHMEIVNKIYFLNLFSKYSSQICCHTHIRFDSGPSFVCSRCIYNTHSTCKAHWNVRLPRANPFLGWSLELQHESNHLVHLHGFYLFRYWHIITLILNI